MTWLDYAVFGVLAISIAVGAWRGVVREVISLAGWVIAFLAANLLAGPVGEAIPASVTKAEYRVALAFVAVFVGSLIVTSLLALLLSKIAAAVGLGGLDRFLGSLFGLARGVLLALGFALLAGLTALPRMAPWKDSVSGPALAQAAQWLKPWLPPAFSARLRYD